MTAGAVNNPPTPVAESVNPAIPADETCEQIKARYGVETASHKENEKKKSSSYQSHHIFQDAAANSLIDRASAVCVLLANSHKGTAHQITTARQNGRRDNKTSAKNFGELKKLSKADLVESFNKGKNIPQKDAEKLADCLVAEAEEKIKKKVKQETGEDVDDQTPVNRIGSCLPAETLVWLTTRRKLRAGSIASGDCIRGRSRSLRVVRVDTCHNAVLRLWIDGCAVALAPFHRVRTAAGRLVRAEELRLGELLDTHYGPKAVQRIERDPAVRTLFELGMGEAFDCRIGEIGLWTELPNTGVPVSRRVALTAFEARTMQAGAPYQLVQDRDH